MKDIYVVTRSQWEGNRYETHVVFAFERLVSAQEYVSSMNARFADYEYEIETVEVVEE